MKRFFACFDRLVASCAQGWIGALLEFILSLSAPSPGIFGMPSSWNRSLLKFYCSYRLTHSWRLP